MFEFTLHHKKVQLRWYQQELITTSFNSIYGSEILSRGFDVETNESIPTNTIFEYLNQHNDTLLSMVSKQITDLFLTKTKQYKLQDSVWINIPGALITNNTLFNKLWNTTLQQLTTSQKNSIILEICEDSTNETQTSAVVAFLQKNSFRVALDDFGAGHSNLIKLSQSHFDFIKLDLNLIKHVPQDLWKTSLYGEIINLCSSKGGLIVAEGIETQVQSDFIRWAGVDLIQGFLYSVPKPIPLSNKKAQKLTRALAIH